MYVRQLSAKSALVRSLNDGVPPLSRTEHILADLWALQARQEYPPRAEMEAKARATAKRARVIELRATFQKRKHTYGLE